MTSPDRLWLHFDPTPKPKAGSPLTHAPGPYADGSVEYVRADLATAPDGDAEPVAWLTPSFYGGDPVLTPREPPQGPRAPSKPLYLHPPQVQTSGPVEGSSAHDLLARIERLEQRAAERAEGDAAVAGADPTSDDGVRRVVVCPVCGWWEKAEHTVGEGQPCEVSDDPDTSCPGVCVVRTIEILRT
jgi:hypothetical protein